MKSSPNPIPNIPRKEQMQRLMERLYPICRSITGNGVRETLKILQEHIPLQVHEVPSGTQVLDWTIPKEWNIKDAYILDPGGKKIIDFHEHNLHVLNYSIPVNKKLSLAELQPHLYTLPDQPDLIPYHTSYYNPKWGFCMAHNQYQQLKEGEYEVVIDSTLEDGSLTYAELFIEGKTKDEVLISTHICHPSLCNDNLSGICVATFLARQLLEEKELDYSYRFVFVPGTIGAITWLSRNEDKTDRIKHGLVASLLGGPGNFTYKKSRQGDAEIDRIAQHFLKRKFAGHKIIDFIPYGYDERQYCSPGFNLPVGSLTRTPYGEFPEYHTSADNPDFVTAESLEQSLAVYTSIMEMIEKNKRYQNLKPKGEPQLGKHGVFEAINNHKQSKVFQMALLWVLNLSDGQHSLLDIAERSGHSFDMVAEAADVLVGKGLVKELESTQ